MFRLSRNILPLFIIVLVSRPGWSSPTDEPSEMLARAEALYYEADFAKSVELLLRAEELLQKQSGHLEEKIDVRMQLALGFIGLNNNDRAKEYLVEVYWLDPDHRIDPQNFAPKVVRLAEEAKAQQTALRCQALLDESQKQLGTGDSDAVAELIAANQAKCPALAALSPKVADLVFKEGLDAFRKDQMTVALLKFRAAVDLKPDHELARQYVELTERKAEVTAGHALLAWHKDFNAGDFALAARDYRELTLVSNSKEADEVRAEYRQALSTRVDAWSRACAMDDVATMERLRAQVDALLPEPSFGEDILEKMKSCSPTSCIQMDSQFALTRLKNRVDPQFSPLLISQVKVLPMTIRVNARIDVNGNVASGELRGGDPVLYNSIRAAVDQWKFLPAVTEGGTRCVDTEIPIVIHYAK